jgi:hypothetical protein
MRIEDAQMAFEDLVQARGWDIDLLTPPQAVEAMVGFYRDERTDECDLEARGDMLLFQWGIYDWGDGEFFEYDLTRQLIPAGEEDPPIFQLSLTLQYEPTPALHQLGIGNRWCKHPGRDR